MKERIMGLSVAEARKKGIAKSTLFCVKKGIAEGKYLKLLFRLHEEKGTLDLNDIKLLCPKCDMGKLCEKDSTVGKLTVYCLESCFLKG